MTVTTRQTSSTRETNRKRDVHERRVRGHDVLARRQRPHTLGVRASDLNAAFSNADAMTAQSPTVPLQKVILQRMRVVPPDDLTARDQALWQMMIAVWRDDIDKKAALDDGEHVIPFETARTYLGVDDDRQIIESMHRLGKTFITFDVDTEFFRSLGTMSMVLGYVRIDKRSGRKTIRFTIPEQLQKILGSCLHYAYVELAAWPKFKTKFAGRLYGFLASYRPMNLTGGTVTIDVSVSELQDILGGGDGQKSHYGSWKRRVLVPAIMGVIDSAKRLTITDWDEKRGPGSGRPVESVSFSVSYSGAKAQEICPNIPDVDKRRVQVAELVLADLKSGDRIHSTEMLPTAQDVGRTINALKEISREYLPFHELVRYWPHALDEAYLGIVSEHLNEPSTTALCGEKLRTAIETKGVRTAFAGWCASEIKCKRFAKLGSACQLNENVRPVSIVSIDDWRTQHADAIRRGEIPDGFRRVSH